MDCSERFVRPVAVQPAPLSQSAADELGVRDARPVALWIEGQTAEQSPWLLQGRGGALLVAPLARLRQASQALAPGVQAQIEGLQDAQPDAWRLRTRRLPLGGKTHVMGILNLTPDSFSDGGRHDAVEAAVRHAHALRRAGADLLDVGGESTRPRATPVDLDEELRRVTPVLEELRTFDLPISIDTYKWPVAERALALGAEIVNDVWAGLRDPAMLPGVAAARAGVVLMHNRSAAAYDRVGIEVQDFLRARAQAAAAAGVDRAAVALDPGIGFAKKPRESLELLRRLQELRSLGHAVLIGTSRKGFIGRISGRGVDEREFGTAATVALGVAFGADVVRVHDVASMVDVVRVADAVVRG